LLQKTNWMLTFLLFTCLFLPVASQAQYTKKHKNKFKEKLEEGSRLIGSDYDFTIEKTKDGSYILKYYDPDSKQLVERIPYSDKDLTIKEGDAAMYSYQGVLLMQGAYKEDLKEGEWIENYPNGNIKAKGKYKEGEKAGKWQYYNFNGELSGEKVWEEGAVVSEQEFAPIDMNTYAFALSDTNLTSKPIFINCNKGKSEEADFQCAQKKMLEFLYTNIRYPGIARENGEQGECVVSFIVEKDGSLSNFEIVRSVSPTLDKESIRVISSMPPWVPGKIDGKPVRVWYNMPVRYKLY
jgi:protein TonB